MAHISLSRDGRLLMSASYVEGKVCLNGVAANGIRAPPAQLVATPPKAHCIIEGHDNVVYARRLAAMRS